MNSSVDSDYRPPKKEKNLKKKSKQNKKLRHAD